MFLIEDAARLGRGAGEDEAQAGAALARAVDVAERLIGALHAAAFARYMPAPAFEASPLFPSQ